MRILVVVAATLALASCTVDAAPEPSSPAPSSAPTGDGGAGGTDAAGPTASAAPLVVPEPIEGEVGRAVFSAIGEDGVPETVTEILAVPEKGVRYSAEGMCVATVPGARFGFELRTAGEEENDDVVLAIDDVCSGVGLLVSSVELDDVPVQVTLTQTDGIASAWVRVVPSASLTP